MHSGSRSEGRPQNSPSTFKTTTITTIAPMMYRIEYMADSFLSLDNDRSGPRYGARRALRVGVVPLDAGWRQTHHGRAQHSSSPMDPDPVFHLAVRLS
jgi:hypothetical protein